MHFTGRLGRLNRDVTVGIASLDAVARMRKILTERAICGFQTFFSLNGPVVCFTEIPVTVMSELVAEQRYLPWGIGFSKDFVLRSGGAPAVYLRGDIWDRFADSDAPDEVKALATLYWPGIEPGTGRTIGSITKQNEWAHEREWRVPVPFDQPTMAFDYGDVVSIVAPSEEVWIALRASLGLDRPLDHVRVIPIARPLTFLEEVARDEAERDARDAAGRDDPWSDRRVREMLGLPPEG